MAQNYNLVTEGVVRVTEKKYIIGIDTGGTFTDIVALDSSTGETIVSKAPTTPHDFSIGVINAVEEVAKLMGLSRRGLLEQCSAFKHGSTVATNAVITRRVAKVGFITTKGFEDTTLIGRAVQKVDGLSDEEVAKMAYITKPEPLVPKSRLKGVYERIDFRGGVVVPINLEDAREQIRCLVEEEQVDAIGVSFLFSWVNPVHEQQVKELISEMYHDRDIFLTFSHELVPLVREYARANTVIINCLVGKVVEHYLANLNLKLREDGFTGNFSVMQSNGGIIRWDRVAPARMLSSGPAGGVIGSHYTAKTIGQKNVITTDMGGTSFDAALIRDGEWSYEREPIIQRWRLLLPMLKVDSIGAGGGTIARVDPLLRRLMVGPDSAGAAPGPVCYDAGGTEPTVCDADLVLGFLNSEYFLGGRMKLNRAKAEKAIQERIADPLNMSVIEAAAGIYTIINAHMADLIRTLVMRTGLLPEEFTLFAFGGTGPVHAAYYGGELGVKRIYCFPASAVFCALGIAGADVVHTSSTSMGYRMPVDAKVLDARLDEIEDKLAHDMEEEGFGRRDLEFRHVYNMRYQRQVNYLSVTMPAKRFGQDKEIVELIGAWKRKFEEIYGRGSAFPKAGIELVSVDVDAIGKVIKPVVQRYPNVREDASDALKGHRMVFFPGGNKGFVETRIYEYGHLRSGNVIEGPAIIESPTSTIVIPPEKLARVDEFNNVVIEL